MDTFCEKASVTIERLVFCIVISIIQQSYSDVKSEDAIVAFQSGKMLRCRFSSDDFCCSNLNNAGSTINALTISGLTLYAGLESGILWNCPVNIKHSCKTFTDFGIPINALAYDGSFIYVGLNTGTMLRCHNVTKFCETMNEAYTPITSMEISDNYIYAGLVSGIMWRCPLHCKHSCVTFNTAASAIKSLAADHNGYLFAGLLTGIMWRCSLETAHSCETYNNAGGVVSINALAVGNQMIYAGLSTKIVWACWTAKKNSCDDIDILDSAITAIRVYRSNYDALSTKMAVTFPS